MTHPILNPRTYLQDLVDYAITHIKKDPGNLSLTELEGLFHQPFEALLALDLEQDIQVPQIRLCIEVLRKYVAQLSLSDQASDALAQSEEAYLESAYRSILLFLGISLEELSEAEEADRQRMARRLGISEVNLTNLPTELSQLTEHFLQEAFGWHNTSQVAIGPLPEASFLSWRKEQIAERAEEMFNTENSEEKTEWITAQEQSALENLAVVISKAEATVLPDIRIALIEVTDKDARELSQTLLIDCEYGVNHKVTRIWQATLTLQQLIQTMRSGLLKDTHSDLNFDAKDFKLEWEWMGNYKNWQAAMQVFLYPENLLKPTMPKGETRLFRNIVNRLRKNRILSVDATNQAVTEYEQYFQDISQLKVEVTCETITQLDETGSLRKNLFHLFGKTNNGKVYWSFYNQYLVDAPQSHWELIPGFQNFKVNRLLSALTYENSNAQRHIYLFAKGYFRINKSGLSNSSISINETLVFTTYNLETQEWKGELINLGNPDTGIMNVRVEQRTSEQARPHFILKRGNRLYSRYLNEQGDGWAEGSNWNNILQASFITFLLRVVRGMSHYYVLAKTQEVGQEARITIFAFRNGNNNSQGQTHIENSIFHGAVVFGSTVFYFSNETYYKIWLDGSNVAVSAPQLNLSGLRNFSIHNGKSLENVGSSIQEEGFRLAFIDEQGAGQAFFKPVSDNSLGQYLRTQILPTEVRWNKLKPDFNQNVQSQRKQSIQQTIENNDDAPKFILDLFWEAYYFLPMMVALQLQRSQQYNTSRDYFRLVYDYTLPLDERKIFYGLKQEELNDLEFERPDNWLEDFLDSHFIAQSRRNAYTRYTIMSLCRCFLQEADSEFTKYTLESIDVTRHLFLTVLELLATPEINDVPGYWGNTLEVPKNRVLNWIRLHAELGLFKVHSGRNIAGEKQSVYSSSQVEFLGSFGNGLYQPVVTSSVHFTSTPYHYSYLIERAKQLANLSQQMEMAFLSALEKLESNQLNLLNAKNDVELSKATVRLQDLRVKEASDGVKLAELQRFRSEIQEKYFSNLLTEGKSGKEIAALGLLSTSALYHTFASFAHRGEATIETIKSIISFGIWGNPSGSVAGILTSMASATSTTSNLLSTIASYERRAQKWQHQHNLARQDIRIGNQQIVLSKDRLQIAGQEHVIANIRNEHTEAVVNFLMNKFLNVELYEWMSDILEEVYSFFLQQATATAQLAAQQLAFERQKPVPPVIISNYWTPPSEEYNNSNKTTDRRGLTGSARLLQDIYQLDQIAFQTDERKLELTKTISLARLSPAEFQGFRENGVFRFYTPMELFDQDFPGHYLRMIKRVRVSIIALTSPTDGINASLSSNGISRIILENQGTFVEREIKRTPESIAFTSPLNATGLFELQQDNAKLLPFESTGVDTFWELELPKASNRFDFSTIADVLLTIEYTALNSENYRQQVIERLDRTFSGDRAFSFRHELADQWYDLNNPDLLDTPMQISVETTRADFPPNIEALSIRHVVLYFSRKDASAFEVAVRHLKFTPADSDAAIGENDQNIETTNGIISTRSSSNAQAWDSFISGEQAPFGTWELYLQDSDELRSHFAEDRIEDILFVITYEGMTPEWPA